MKKIIRKILSVSLSILLGIASCGYKSAQIVNAKPNDFRCEASNLIYLRNTNNFIDDALEIDILSNNEFEESIEIVEEIELEEIVVVEEATEQVSIIYEYPLSYSEIELLALLVMAEAENQPEYGLRLVIDVVLNRMDNGYGDTIRDVIYAPGQFAVTTNGRLERCYVRDDIYQLCLEELTSRSDYSVLYFRSDYYHSFGTPVINVGDHYFSTK